MIVNFFVKFFGEDYFKYVYFLDYGICIEEVFDFRRSFVYDYDDWEVLYENVFNFVGGVNFVSFVDLLKVFVS